MSATEGQFLIAFATIVCSVGLSAFVSGTRWGRMQSDVNEIKNRLLKIEALFVLKLRDEDE